METFAEDAELVGGLREYLWEHALLRSRVVAEKAEQGAKFADYFAYEEPIAKVPSHRALALFRGRNEGVLTLSLVLPEDEVEGRPRDALGSAERRIAAHFRVAERGRPADDWLRETVRWAWRARVHAHLDLDLKGRLRDRAEEEAIASSGGT